MSQLETSEPREIKIVFTGPMGAGKTTAIAAISNIVPVLTDVANNDRESFDKETTTVALDYGQIVLEDGVVVRLYGTPGQARFGFMRRILCEGAIGVVLLLDGSAPDALAQLRDFLGDLRVLDPLPAMVVGVGRCESTSAAVMTDVLACLESLQLALPAFRVDVRRREDVLLLVDAMVCQLEARIGPEVAA